LFNQLTKGRDMYKHDGEQRNWRIPPLRWFIFTALALTISVLAGQGVSAQSTTTCHGSAATIVGTDGPDDLTGTSGPDVVALLDGADSFDGIGANDVICGGNGKDLLVGGPADDTLDGGRANDELRGDLERVMNSSENRMVMRIPRAGWFLHDLRFPHS
jgi:Ca2+-binding RTX toxin-like protein